MRAMSLTTHKMTKKELIKVVATETGFEIKDVATVTDALVETIRKVVKDGNEVTINWFGAFRLKHYKSKKARDIRRGTEVMIPERKLPTFKPSKSFML